MANSETRKLRRRARPAVLAHRAEAATERAAKERDLSKCLPWAYDDGGRFAAGWPDNDAGDCVTRAIAIATGQPYRDVWALVCRAIAEHAKNKKHNADHGADLATIRALVARLDGWAEIETTIQGRKTKRGAPVYEQAQDLPTTGRLLVLGGRHAFALIDGRVHDTAPIRRVRTVHRFFRKEETP
jgi:hypothetical protein